MQNTLLTVIAESFTSTVFLMPGQNLLFEAMYWFGKLGSAEVAAYVVGSVAGCLVNWAVGLMIAKLRDRNNDVFSDVRYMQYRGYFSRYGVWMLLLYWMHFGALLVILAGFFRAKRWQILALTAIGSVLGLYVEFPAALG